MKKKKILLDMSATILHHGHIRLIKKASKYGKVVIGLTKDAQIKKFKGYTPEISFKHRKEILFAAIIFSLTIIICCSIKIGWHLIAKVFS